MDAVIDIAADKLSRYPLMNQIQQGLEPYLAELLDSRVILRPNHEDDDDCSHVVESVGALPASGARLGDIGRASSNMPEVTTTTSSKSKKGGKKGGHGDGALWDKTRSF